MNAVDRPYNPPISAPNNRLTLILVPQLREEMVIRYATTNTRSRGDPLQNPEFSKKQNLRLPVLA